jgi:hypothetical protein
MTWVRTQALGVVAILIALSSGAYAVTTAPKDSVVSKSIKNGAVKSKDLAGNAVTSAQVRNNTLTGADIDESSLSLPATDRVEHLVLRLPPNSPTTVRASHNGLDLLLGCTTAAGLAQAWFTHSGGVSYQSAPSTGFLFAERQGTQSNVGLFGGGPGEADSSGTERLDYRRASDGATARVDVSFANDNDLSFPSPLSNDDCVFTVVMTYSA